MFFLRITLLFLALAAGLWSQTGEVQQARLYSFSTQGANPTLCGGSQFYMFASVGDGRIQFCQNGTIFSIQPWGANLDSIRTVTASGDGLLSLSGGVAAFRTLQGTTNQIAISNPGGAAGNPTIGLTVPFRLGAIGGRTGPVEVGTSVPTTCEPGDLFWKSDTGILYGCPIQNSFEPIVAGAGEGGGAPTDTPYITQIPDDDLSAEQAMSLLATGLVKNTTSTGVQSIAVENVDYAGAVHAFRHEPGGADDLGATYQRVSEKSQADGYASLGGEGFVPNAELDPTEVFLKTLDSHDFGSGTSATITHNYNFSASGAVSCVYSDGLIDCGTAQFKAGSIVLEGSGSGTIEGQAIKKDLLFDTVFDADLAAVQFFDHETEIIKIDCRTTGGGTETVNLNFTRNGTAILTAALVADNGGQSACASGCDVATIDLAQSTFAIGDRLTYDYISQANSPATLSCKFTQVETP